MPEIEDESAATFNDFPKSFLLTEQATGKQVVARFIPLTRDVAHERIDKRWWVNLPCHREVKRSEPDHNWVWADLVGELRCSRHGGYVRGWAVEANGHEEAQGAILYRTNTSSLSKGPDGESCSAVYGAYLACAPRNRDRVMGEGGGRFKGVGHGLLKLAIAHSHYLGGEGVVTLASVDYEPTIELYRKFGFCPASELPEDRLLMELTKEAANKYLKEMGLR